MAGKRQGTALKALFAGAGFVLAVVAVGVFCRLRFDGGTGSGALSDGVNAAAVELEDEAPTAAPLAADGADGDSEETDSRDEEEEASRDEREEEPLTEDEKRESEEEAKVDAFDDLTDKWTEPAGKGVAMADVDAFVKAFRSVPKARQDECVHRALNLVPDENVMLLAGILMDTSADKEVVETVFNDILNRDEDVKKPILQQIFKDKKHPCWADTAWILDVTDELPKNK